MRSLVVAIVMLFAIAVSGCVPVAIGGAAAGGYLIGQDERPASVIAADGRITTSIKSRLIADKYVDGFRISVQSYEGIVTLQGEVGSNFVREHAGKIANSVEGVETVRNEIRVVRVPTSRQ
jgi:hyperosmotically inducible periplasmic protein